MNGVGGSDGASVGNADGAPVCGKADGAPVGDIVGFMAKSNAVALKKKNAVGAPAGVASLLRMIVAAHAASNASFICLQ